MNKTASRIIYENIYNPIKEYWAKLESGEIITSVKVYKVYKEIMKVINSPSAKWIFNVGKSNHALEFVENYCKHSKGKMGGKPFIMELWQKALVAAMFGIVGVTDGLRKYREVLLIVARKNGKSTLASAIGLYLQIADGEAGAEIYAVATKKEQSKIIWLEAKRMIKKSPPLKARIKTLVSEMTSEKNDSSFKYLGSDSDTLDGLNVHGALMDEIHAWKDMNLYDVIKDGCTSRDEPMIFITSTAGTVREQIYDSLYEEAERIINGYEEDEGYKNERFLPIVYEIDKVEEWKQEEAWIKANPGLGTIKKLDQLQDKVSMAKVNPRKLKNLLTKDFNVRQSCGETWLLYDEIINLSTFTLSTDKRDNSKIKAGEHYIGELKPKYGIGGCDLSKTTDLTSAKVIFQVPGNENIFVLSMYWLPADLLEKRIEEDGIRYDIWLEQGLMRVCEGNSINPEDVTLWFREIQEKYGIYLPWIGYDSWSAKYWVVEMERYFGKMAMENVIQGKFTLSQPMGQLGLDIQAKKVIYNNNPMDKWCISNTAVDRDINNNIQPIKTSNSKKRIDGLASLLNAYVVLQRYKQDYHNMLG